MWKIHLDGAALHVPGTEVVIASGTLKQGRNSADSLTFDIPVTHPLYDACLNGVMTAKYVVSKDAEIVSKGRILSRTVNPFDGTAHVECEGELAYLNDGVISAYDFKGSPRDLLAQMLDEYNAQCDQGNEILLGNVTAYDPNDYIVRGSQKPVNCMTELIAKTANSSTGGWLVLRFEDKTYLDWLAEPNATGNQSIAKGANLLDISEELDGATLITAIMPIGAPLSQDYVRLPNSADGQLSGDVYRKGQFVYSKTLVDRYGWHAELREWEDVANSANLRSRAIAAIQALAFEAELQISALDLSDAGYDVDHFKIGQRVAVTCDAIGGEMIVAGATWRLDNPASSSFTFGTEKSLTKKAAATAAAADAAGWTGYNDNDNYLWHESMVQVPGMQYPISEQTSACAESRYALSEDALEKNGWPVYAIGNDIIPNIRLNSPRVGTTGTSGAGIEMHTGGMGFHIYNDGSWSNMTSGSVQVWLTRQYAAYCDNAGIIHDQSGENDDAQIYWVGAADFFSSLLNKNGLMLSSFDAKGVVSGGGFMYLALKKYSIEVGIKNAHGVLVPKLVIDATGVHINTTGTETIDLNGTVRVNGQPI